MGIGLQIDATTKPIALVERRLARAGMVDAGKPRTAYVSTAAAVLRVVAID
jgi:hypothetical protein